MMTEDDLMAAVQTASAAGNAMKDLVSEALLAGFRVRSAEKARDNWRAEAERLRAALVNAVERLDYLATEDTHANRQACRLREAHPIVAELVPASKGQPS
jgi:hypothetical protein